MFGQAELGPAPRERGLESFPPEWRADFIRLSDLICEISKEYGSAVSIHMYDPRSIQGMAKSIRHGIHQYPTFLVNRRVKIVGLAQEMLERAIHSAQGQVGLPHEKR